MSQTIHGAIWGMVKPPQSQCFAGVLNVSFPYFLLSLYLHFPLPNPSFGMAS